MFGKKEQRLEVPKETKSGYYVPRWFAEDVMEALAFARLEDGLSDERVAGFLLGTAFCAIPRGDYDHGKDVRGFLRDCSAKVDALLEVLPSISEADQAIRGWHQGRPGGRRLRGRLPRPSHLRVQGGTRCLA